ncbi:MAG: hypothetical protein QXK51_11500 [Candidatus Methanomethylicia archaeon]
MIKDEDILKVFERALKIALTPIKVENPRGGEFITTMEQMKLLPILFEHLLKEMENE